MEFANQSVHQDIHLVICLIITIVITIKVVTNFNQKINHFIMLNNNNILEINNNLSKLLNNSEIIKKKIIMLEKIANEDNTDTDREGKNNQTRDILEDNAIFYDRLLQKLQNN